MIAPGPGHADMRLTQYDTQVQVSRHLTVTKRVDAAMLLSNR